MCPKMGIGTSISTAVSERTAVVIEDYMFDASTAGELQPEESPSDFHDTWDLDGTDFTPEASPDDEGYWDDFENIVTNYNYEELGSEIITNGGFDTDSNWDKGTGWSIQSGYAQSDGTNAPLDQTNILTIGKTYKLVITVTDINNGNLSVRLGDSSSHEILSISSNGTYTAYGVAGGTRLRLRSQGGFDGKIDNVSVKQVDPNNRWQLQYTGTGDWSITDKLNFENVNGGSAQLNVFEVGTTYEITVDYVFTSGTRLILPYDGSNFPTGGVITTPGSVNGYTYYYTPNSTTLLIYSDGNGNGSIDSVTVREYAIQPLDV